MSGQKRVKIFTTEQQSPCGPQSCCCGPIGQSAQEIATLKNAIEKLGLEVEIYDVQKMNNLRDNSEVYKIFQRFDAQAIPVITVDEEVACLGKSDLGEIITAIKNKI